eukprot:g8942.t1
MISSTAHLQFCRAFSGLQQTSRLQRQHRIAPRIRRFATFQSEAADDFEEFDELSYDIEESPASPIPTPISSEIVTGDRKSGVVKWFNDKKGFGFITPDDGSEDIFVHQTSIQSTGFRSLRDGEAVEYEPVFSSDGRLAAAEVTGPEGREPLGSDRNTRYVANFDRSDSYISNSEWRSSETWNSSSGVQAVVFNIPYSVTEYRLREFFSDYDVVDCVLKYDELGRPKGIGFVKFATNEKAKQAVADLNEAELDGRAISVRFDRYE